MLDVPGIANVLQTNGNGQQARRLDRLSRTLIGQAGLRKAATNAAHAVLYTYLLGSVSLEESRPEPVRGGRTRADAHYTEGLTRDHRRHPSNGREADEHPCPPPLGSLIPIEQDSDADRDAAAVLDPDTYVNGAPFDALARLRATSPVHPVVHAGPAEGVAADPACRRAHASAATPRPSPAATATPSSRSSWARRRRCCPASTRRDTCTCRKLINQGFTARNVQRLEPHMRKVARDIVADITEKGEFDAVPDISAEMSLQVIADVLGVPA